jgi:hypothetical protein
MDKIQKEDAPTNAVAQNSVAGITGDPPVSVKTQKRIQKKQKTTSTPVIMSMLRRKLVSEETFAGAVVFEVSTTVFHTAKMEKRKGKHWRTYLEEDDCFRHIREYAQKNPKKGIILRNERTGEMFYARYGKKG